jgi:hypothetical protein
MPLCPFDFQTKILSLPLLPLQPLKLLYYGVFGHPCSVWGRVFVCVVKYVLSPYILLLDTPKKSWSLTNKN